MNPRNESLDRACKLLIAAEEELKQSIYSQDIQRIRDNLNGAAVLFKAQLAILDPYSVYVENYLKTLRRLITVYSEKKNPHVAICFWEIVDTWTQILDKFNSDDVLRNAYYDLLNIPEQIEDASVFIEKALELNYRIKVPYQFDFFTRANGYIQLGIEAEKKKEYQKAIEYFYKGVDVINANPDQFPDLNLEDYRSILDRIKNASDKLNEGANIQRELEKYRKLNHVSISDVSVFRKVKTRETAATLEEKTSNSYSNAN